MQALLCARFCRYYHPEKTDEPGCGGLHRLARTPGVARLLAGLDPAGVGELSGLSPRDPRLLAVCGSCPYLVDGCDFRDPAGPLPGCEPCGGLEALAALWSRGEAL